MYKQEICQKFKLFIQMLLSYWIGIGNGPEIVTTN